MPQVVTPESLDALAAVAFKTIVNPKVEYQYENHACARDEIFELLKETGKLEGHSTYSSGFCVGVEFGLAVGAAIVTHGLDSKATAKAIKAEFSKMQWAEGYNGPSDGSK